MSRKREQRRQKDTELARQLGLKRSELEERGDALLQKPRAGHLVLTARSLLVDSEAGAVGRLFGKRTLRAVAASVFLVDGHGPHHLGTESWKFVAAPEGTLLVPETKTVLEAKRRYERPAHFVVVVAGGVADARFSPVLDDPSRLRLVSMSGDRIAVDDRLLADAAWETPRALSLGDSDGSPLEGVTSAAAVSSPGVHRSQRTLVFPLVSTDGAYQVTFDLKI